MSASEDRKDPQSPAVDAATELPQTPSHEDAVLGSEGSGRTIGLGIYKQAEGAHEKDEQRFRRIPK